MFNQKELLKVLKIIKLIKIYIKNIYLNFFYKEKKLIFFRILFKIVI